MISGNLLILVTLTILLPSVYLQSSSLTLKPPMEMPLKIFEATTKHSDGCALSGQSGKDEYLSFDCYSRAN